MKTTEWVEIEDWLPSVGLKIKARSRSGRTLSGKWEQINHEHHSINIFIVRSNGRDDYDWINDVTHWQPLPDPPQPEPKHECCSAAKDYLCFINGAWFQNDYHGDRIFKISYCPWCGEKLEGETTLAVDEILQAIQDRKAEIALALMEKTEKAKTGAPFYISASAEGYWIMPSAALPKSIRGYLTSTTLSPTQALRDWLNEIWRQR